MTMKCRNLEDCCQLHLHPQSHDKVMSILTMLSICEELNWDVSRKKFLEKVKWSYLILILLTGNHMLTIYFPPHLKNTGVLINPQIVRLLICSHKDFFILSLFTSWWLRVGKHGTETLLWGLVHEAGCSKTCYG